MTVGSDVKQCLASLKGIEAGLSGLALRTQDASSAELLHHAMLRVGEVKKELEQRAGELERQELQYKGF